MNYQRKPAQLSIVRVYCDCGEELKTTGYTLLSNPPMYEHECPKCGIRYNLPSAYPKTEVEEIDISKEVLD